MLAAAPAAAARDILERAFLASEVGTGLMTGYYEPVLRGSLRPTALYATPLLALPTATVTLPSRAEIEAGALAGQGLELVWVDSAVDAFFLHIQGSGRVRLPDGGLLRLGYAGQNGHRYFAIGRALIQRGAISREAMSMQAIRAWLDAAGPAAARSLMQQNPSYIFFRVLQGLGADEGPPGTMGVPLTPLRSVAVDTAFIPMGAPLFLAGAAPAPRLVVAQDTGGAIRGAGRVDLFWGWGDAAGARAGLLNQPARVFLLRPRPPG